jgi:hypothetical protein
MVRSKRVKRLPFCDSGVSTSIAHGDVKGVETACGFTGVVDREICSIYDLREVFMCFAVISAEKRRSGIQVACYYDWNVIMFDTETFYLGPELLSATRRRVWRDVWMKDQKCFIDYCSLNRYTVSLKR